jgi:hypothetical protein
MSIIGINENIGGPPSAQPTQIGYVENLDPSGLLPPFVSTLGIVALTSPVKLPCIAWCRCSAKLGHDLMVYAERKTRSRRLRAAATAGILRSYTGRGLIYRSSMRASVEEMISDAFKWDNAQASPAPAHDSAKEAKTLSTSSSPSMEWGLVAVGVLGTVQITMEGKRRIVGPHDGIDHAVDHDASNTLRREDFDEILTNHSPV